MALVTPVALARTGAWLDEVTFFIEGEQAKALDMLLKDEIQAYFFDFDDPDLFAQVKEEEDLWYVVAYGNYNDVTFNPVGPEFPATGKLNPFAITAIREAMNYVLDRDYMAEELAGGLAIPRYLAISPAFPDYARVVDTAKALEVKYAYDFEKGRDIIAAEMEKLGATIQNGKWTYKGDPVNIIVLIRTEDKRTLYGDYISTQLENLNFTVERSYKTSSEASPLWLFGEPGDGLWHVYTGGWISTQIDRDQADNFDFHYTQRSYPLPLWQNYNPPAEFDALSEALANSDFTSVEERNEMMAQALEGGMSWSARLFVTQDVAAFAARDGVEVTADLSGGFYGSQLWPYTLRYTGQEGGSMKIASSDILTDPWNPVAGTAWVYDAMIFRACQSVEVLPDPFTGLAVPNRIERAEVEVRRGLPVSKTMDWITLKYVDKILVPEDAWMGWDAATMQITNPPAGTEAKAKITVYYDENLWNTQWHDGSKLDLADIVFQFIFNFDIADPASPVYDESQVPTIESFKNTFKGIKIIQEDPLIIEFYSDETNLDAETMVDDWVDDFWPGGYYGPAPWHGLAVGWLAESKKLTAFTGDKANALGEGIEWMNYIAGPVLNILAANLDDALAQQFIPYEEVLGDYVTKAEASTRYQNLKTWYNAHGHFWVGNGPFWLKNVDTTAKQVTLARFEGFTDDAAKWSAYTEPALPKVSVTAPDTVVQALAGNFSVEVTFKDEPYAVSDISFIKYILIDPRGQVTSSGVAEPIEDGLWEVVLTSDDTSVLQSGSYSLQAIAASKKVSIPTSGSAAFIAVAFEDYLSGEIAELTAELETTTARLGNLTSDLEDEVDSLKGLSTTLMILAVVALVLGAGGIVLGLRK